MSKFKLFCGEVEIGIIFVNDSVAIGVSALDAVNNSAWQRHLAEKNRCFKCIVYKTNKKHYEIST